MKNMMRLFSSVKKLSVYQAPYFEALNGIKSDFITEAPEIMKEKYYKFLPFYLESRLTPTEKLFVVNMEVVPERSVLVVTALQIGSLITKEIPIKDVQPVTVEDYECGHFGGKLLESADFFDLEMIYINRPMQQFLVFDKEGKWNEEGVNHSALSMEKTFNEHKWYDYGCGPSANHQGGNPNPWP
jgi:hypothetical protein